MKRHRIRMALLIAALASAMALAACSNDNNGEAQQPAGNEAAQNGGNAGSGAANGGAAGSTTPAADPEQLIEAAGTYIGQIDPHSIEIETNGQPVAYQLAEGLELTIGELNENDPVNFKYTETPIEGDDTAVQRTIMEIARASSGAEEPAAGGGAEAGESDSKLPATKSIAVELEGNQEQREAKAVVGDGYTLYMFEQFSFDAAAGRLSMNVDPEYYVDIAKLPADANLDELRKEGEAWVESTGGEAEERTGDALGPALRDASFFLIASKDNLTKEYFVKEIDGAVYSFKVNMPHREASEGFGPLAFASINSIVTSK